MRTMYIILSWVGWGWFVLVVPTVAALVRRRSRQQPRPGGTPAVGTEAEAAHEQ